MRARKVRPVCPSKYIRVNSENRLRMYARSRTDMWKIVRNCVPFLSKKNTEQLFCFLLRFYLFLREIIAHGLRDFARYRARRKERRRLSMKEGDQVHVTACPLLDARTAWVSRRNSFVSFLAKPFGIEVKAREKRNYVYLRLDRLVMIKKNRGNREGFSSTFISSFKRNRLVHFYRIVYIYIRLFDFDKERDFNKFVILFVNFFKNYRQLGTINCG